MPGGPVHEALSNARSPHYSALVTDERAARLDDPSTDPFEVAEAAAAVVRERTGVVSHDVALVLGSGWADAGALARGSSSPRSTRVTYRGSRPPACLARVGSSAL